MVARFRLQTRAYTYVDDAVRAIVAAGAAEVPASRNTILNIGSDEKTSVLDIARLVGGEVRHIYPNPRSAFEERRKAADYSRARSLLHWQPAVSFRSGLALTYPDLAGLHSEAPRSLPSRARSSS